MNRQPAMLAAFFFIVVYSLFSAPATYGCTCGSTLAGIQPCQEYWGAAAVFAGQVTELSVIPKDMGDGRRGYKQRLVRLAIEESFRGVEGSTVEVLTGMGGGDCGYDFRQMGRYFVYAYRSSDDNQLHVAICGRTRLLTEATGDLEYARAVKRGDTGGILFGIVLRYRRASYIAYGQHQGMEGIAVTIEGNGKRLVLSTNNEGRFQIGGLPAGTYRVRAELPKSLRALSEQEVRIEEGRCAGAEFVTSSLATVQGRLVDAEGVPVAKVGLTLIPARSTEAEEREWRGREVHCYTDDSGQFTCQNVPPGEYVLVFNQDGQPSQFEPPFARTYYPGTADLAAAKVIAVTEGKDVEAGDFRLPPRLFPRTINGIVEWEDGRPAAGAQVMLEYTERVGTDLPVTADEQGRFSLKGYEGYSYRLHTYHENRGRIMHSEPLDITIGSENDPVKLRITKMGHSPLDYRPKQRK